VKRTLAYLYGVMLIYLPSVELTDTTLFSQVSNPPILACEGEKTYFAIMYALPYHPISLIELKCAVIIGIACDSFMRISSVERWRMKTRTVTTIDPSRVIKKPTITMDPSVRYSFAPVRKVFFVACSVSVMMLGVSGEETPFSGSVRTEDGADLSMLKTLKKTDRSEAE